MPTSVSISAGPRAPGDWSQATWLAILVTFVMLVVDVVFGSDVPRQLATLSYAETTGTIVSSEVRSESTSQGSGVYGVAATYEYVVDGRSLRGTRWSADDFMVSGPWAAQTVARLRPGTRVPVYYSRAEPTRAFLHRGFDTGDLVGLGAWLPWNLVALGAWLHVRQASRLRARGLAVFEHGPELRVAVPTFQPLTLAIGAFLLAGFLVFSILIMLCGTHPPLLAYGVVWTLVLSAAGLVYVRRRRFLRRGGGHLVLDTAERTITIPRLFGDLPEAILPWSDIARLTVKPARVPAEGGGSQSSQVDLAVVAETRDDAVGVELATFGDADEAERFAAWLREHTV